MLTTCTACGTQFRVSTAQIRAVHGLVRCSRCHSVFDAFETLREEFETAGPAVDTPAEQTSASDQQTVVVEYQELAEISASLSEPAVDADDPEIQLQQEEQAPPVDDLFTALWGESQLPAAADAASTTGVPGQTHADTPGLIEDHIPKPAALMRDQALYKHVELPPREQREPKATRRRMTVSPWGAGAVIAALLLAVQVVNAYRQTLSHAALIGPPLSALYAALGHPLTAPASPGEWQVSDINVTSDPDTPGALSISGTLANQAGFAQPWPILRIELTDRYGDALQARDFTANLYLPASKAAVWLNPGLATRFRIDVVDPGPEAVGFQVQPCADLKGSRVCARSATTD